MGSESAFFTLLAGEFVDVIEKRVELVKLALRNRIELVVVAASATQGQSQKDGAGRVHAVHHCFHAILLKVDAAFEVDQCVAMKAGGDQLITGRIRAEDRRRSAR